ncbi:MAG: Inosine-5'-monophosphate dehydrogenase / CBS domain, partial [uncultured Sphingomonadaceae bacterium]
GNQPGSHLRRRAAEARGVERAPEPGGHPLAGNSGD